MTLPIPLSQITDAERGKRWNQVVADNHAYTLALKRRQEMQAYLQRSTAQHNAASIANARNQLQRAQFNETQAKSRLAAFKKTNDPYFAEWNKYTAISKANPGGAGGLDALLAKLTPYDPQAAAEKMTAQRSLDDVLSQLTQQRQNLAEDYTTNSRQLDTQQPNDSRAVLGNYSGRGMAYSSGYGTAVGNLSDAYANQRSALTSALNRGNANATGQEASARSSYLDAIGTILGNTTANLTTSAGQLGLGANSDVPYLVELARRRLAAGG